MQCFNLFLIFKIPILSFMHSTLVRPHRGASSPSAWESESLSLWRLLRLPRSSYSSSLSYLLPANQIQSHHHNILLPSNVKDGHLPNSQFTDLNSYTVCDTQMSENPPLFLLSFVFTEPPCCMDFKVWRGKGKIVKFYSYHVPLLESHSVDVWLENVFKEI